MSGATSEQLQNARGGVADDLRPVSAEHGKTHQGLISLRVTACQYFRNRSISEENIRKRCSPCQAPSSPSERPESLSKYLSSQQRLCNSVTLRITHSAHNISSSMMKASLLRAYAFKLLYAFFLLWKSYLLAVAAYAIRRDLPISSDSVLQGFASLYQTRTFMWSQLMLACQLLEALFLLLTWLLWLAARSCDSEDSEVTLIVLDEAGTALIPPEDRDFRVESRCRYSNPLVVLVSPPLTISYRGRVPYDLVFLFIISNAWVPIANILQLETALTLLKIHSWRWNWPLFWFFSLDCVFFLFQCILTTYHALALWHQEKTQPDIRRSRKLETSFRRSRGSCDIVPSC